MQHVERFRCGYRRADTGSQTAEFALVTPVVIMLLGIVAVAGLAGIELIQSQHIARETARAAAVSEDSAAWQVADELAGARGLHTSITPASGARQVGDLLTAEIKLQSGIADRFGIDLWLPAKAVMRTEDVP